MSKKITDESLHALTQFLEVDITKGELKVFNQRVGIFPLGSILELFSILKDELGVKKAEKLLYEAGIKFGEKLVVTILKLDEEEFIELNPLQGSEAISKILSFFGLGKIRYDYDESENMAILDYYNSPVKETDNNLFCKFLTGLILSVTSKIYQKKVMVTETKCIKNNSEFCRFEIKM
ncbi:MAG: hypothetical protein ACTSYR_01905 [Candidatus Odinarchaeia archaeon]